MPPNARTISATTDKLVIFRIFFVRFFIILLFVHKTTAKIQIKRSGGYSSAASSIENFITVTFA